jgi:hypothetical protein
LFSFNLKTGVINAVFKLSGIFPLIIVKLKIYERGSENTLVTFLITFTLKPSHPRLFWRFQFLISVSNSYLVMHGLEKKAIFIATS